MRPLSEEAVYTTYCIYNLFYWLGVGYMPIQIHPKRKISQSIYECNEPTIFLSLFLVAATPLTEEEKRS